MSKLSSDSQKIRFANYRLDHLIGSGGFARVYKGWDGESETPLAIKIVDANFSESEFALATAFLEHTSTLTSWRHKNIIKIHRAGFDDNYLYTAWYSNDSLATIVQGGQIALNNDTTGSVSVVTAGIVTHFGFNIEYTLP